MTLEKITNVIYEHFIKPSKRILHMSTRCFQLIDFSVLFSTIAQSLYGNIFINWEVSGLRSLFLFLCILLLQGCSSTNVYLYKRYLSDKEAASISQKLEAAGYQVETNDFRFPDAIQSTTVVYSPMLQSEKSLNTAISLLADIGWETVDILPLFKGNHWYSKNSLGLFLLPEGVKQNDRVASQDLANSYQVRGCDTSVTLHLNRDNTYQMSFANQHQEKTDHLEGIWKLRSYPYLELTSHNKRWWFYFKIEQKVEVDKVSAINILELKPQDNYPFFANCSFVYGLRI